MVQSMIKLENVIKSINSLPRMVNVRKYIPVQEKLQLADEYNELFTAHIHDFENQPFYIGYIFLRMLIVKGYTNIEFEYTYNDYDILEQYGVVDKVIELVGDDYQILMKVISSSDMNKEEK